MLALPVGNFTGSLNEYLIRPLTPEAAGGHPCGPDRQQSEGRRFRDGTDCDRGAGRRIIINVGNRPTSDRAAHLGDFNIHVAEIGGAATDKFEPHWIRGREIVETGGGQPSFISRRRSAAGPNGGSARPGNNIAIRAGVKRAAPANQAQSDARGRDIEVEIIRHPVNINIIIACGARSNIQGVRIGISRRQGDLALNTLAGKKRPQTGGQGEANRGSLAGNRPELSTKHSHHHPLRQ